MEKSGKASHSNVGAGKRLREMTSRWEKASEELGAERVHCASSDARARALERELAALRKKKDCDIRDLERSRDRLDRKLTESKDEASSNASGKMEERFES
jgi:predicted secreted Zn-dependent protease